MKIGSFFSQIDFAVRDGEAESIEALLHHYAKLGITSVDIMADNFDSAYNTSELLNVLKNEGLYTASMFHLIDFRHKENDIIKKLRDDTKRRIEDCAAMQCTMFMPVPTITSPHANEHERSECRKTVAEYINDVSEIAKGYNITTVIENFSDTTCPFSTIADIDYLLTQLPHVQYVLDTGNFWFGGTDVIEACKKFAQRTVHVHLKDIYPNENGCLTVCQRSCDSSEIGGGIIDFEKIFDILASHGYQGGATIEVNDNSYYVPKTEKSIEYLKSIGIMERSVANA